MSLKGKIQTLKGPINPTDLGVTLTHIHLTGHTPDWLKPTTWPGLTYFKADPDIGLPDPEKTVQEVKAFEEAGGQALVEMTAIDWGRKMEPILHVAKQVKSHIIITTGFNRGIFCEPWVYEYSEEKLTDLFIREITKGVEDTEYKAGIIKIPGSYNHIEPVERKIIRAAAMAHLETGAPISSHTDMGTMGLEQLKILRDEGVDLSKVIIGHLDRCLDYYEHKEIAQQGAYVEYDQLGKAKYCPDSAIIDSIIRLTKAGLGKQIVLGLDYGRKSDLIAYGGGPGLGYALTKFAPRLKMAAEAEGLNGNKVFDDLFIKNPSRVLSFGV